MKAIIREKILKIIDERISKKHERAERFSYGVCKVLGHDVASPLTVIAGHAERLIARSEDPKVKAAAEKILNAAHNQRNIIDAAREYIHLNQNRKELEIAPITDHDILDAVIPNFEESLTALNIELSISKEEHPVSLLCDPFQTMDKILTPLMANAIKFSHENSKIEIIARSDANFSIIEVKNRWKPLTAKQIEQFFSMHHDEKGVGVRGEVGRGYTLAIAESYAHLVGGSLSVSSLDDLITLTLKLKKA